MFLHDKAVLNCGNTVFRDSLADDLYSEKPYTRHNDWTH